MTSANLRVPDGNKHLFTAHADGTQNYVCLPNKTGGFALDAVRTRCRPARGKKCRTIGMHFLTPDAAGAAHPSWQGIDGSRAQAVARRELVGETFRAEGAVPWLLLKVSGTTPAHGKPGKYPFARATYVQRIHTSGGVAPASGLRGGGRRRLESARAVSGRLRFLRAVDPALKGQNGGIWSIPPPIAGAWGV